MKSRNTYAEVNVKKFLRNIFEISKRAGLPVAPVLKADAYGHGSVRLAKACQENGVGLLIVAFLEEAIVIRESGVGLPILVLNYFDPSYVGAVISNSISVTVYCEEQVGMLSEMLTPSDRLKVHLNVDTGMGRVGLGVDESVELYETLMKDKRFVVDGVYTHLSSADSPDDEMNAFQLRSFNTFLSMIKKPRYVHVNNSAGATLSKESTGDFCRVGIASYGLQPSCGKNVDYIEPVMSVKSSVSFVKNLKPGQSVGYGHTFVSNDNMRVATVPFGYADGLPRALSNKGEVLIHSKRAGILGRVSMDQIVVDVSGIENVKIGDEVVVIGESGEERITAEEIAELSGTINYEIVCGISKRVPRIYVD